MINLGTEEVLSLSEANTVLPRRHGRAVHLSTLYRWAKIGIKGIRLETIHVGGVLCTSVEALQRFCDQLSREG